MYSLNKLVDLEMSMSKFVCLFMSIIFIYGCVARIIGGEDAWLVVFGAIILVDIIVGFSVSPMKKLLSKGVR